MAGPDEVGSREKALSYFLGESKVRGSEEAVRSDGCVLCKQQHKALTAL